MCKSHKDNETEMEMGKTSLNIDKEDDVCELGKSQQQAYRKKREREGGGRERRGARAQNRS